MSDRCEFDAGDWRVRVHRKRTTDGGSGCVRRAYILVRAGVFAIATLIFAAAFGGNAAAQGGRGGGGGGAAGPDIPLPAATSDAHRSGQATLFDVGSQF